MDSKDKVAEATTNNTPEVTSEVAAKKATPKIKSRAAKTAVLEAKKDREISETVKLSALEKGDVIKKFQINGKDVGSPEVQIALITRRLESLSKHFASNPKDFHSQRGMLDLISRRKRLITYLRKEDVTRYRSTIASLGLRK